MIQISLNYRLIFKFYINPELVKKIIKTLKEAVSRLYGDGRKLAVLLRNRWFTLYKPFRLNLFRSGIL